MNDDTPIEYASKEGLSPGTLVYIGPPQTDPVELTEVAYAASGYFESRDVDVQSVAVEKLNPELCYWYEFVGIHDTAKVKEVCDAFGIHPLVQEDIVNCTQRSKVEDFQKYSFAVIKNAGWNAENSCVTSHHFSLVVGANWVISFRESHYKNPFEAILKRFSDPKGRLRTMGSDYLFYALIDTIVDGYYHVIDALDDAIEMVNLHQADFLTASARHSRKLKNISHHDELKHLQSIFYLKREIHTLKQVIYPLRDMINHLCTAEKPLSPVVKIYMRDVWDHTVHSIESVDTLRETCNAVAEMVLGMISFRTNSIMKILAIVSTIFIPLTFIAGVYGMNFEYMPELGMRYGYFTVLVLMASIAGFVLWILRQKRWL